MVKYKITTLAAGLSLWVIERGLDVSGIESMPLAIGLWVLGGALLCFSGYLWLRAWRDKPKNSNQGTFAEYSKNPSKNNSLVANDEEIKYRLNQIIRRSTLRGHTVADHQAWMQLMKELKEEGRLPMEYQNDNEPTS